MGVKYGGRQVLTVGIRCSVPQREGAGAGKTLLLEILGALALGMPGRSCVGGREAESVGFGPGEFLTIDEESTADEFDLVVEDEERNHPGLIHQVVVTDLAEGEFDLRMGEEDVRGAVRQGDALTREGDGDVRDAVIGLVDGQARGVVGGRVKFDGPGILLGAQPGVASRGPFPEAVRTNTTAPGAGPRSRAWPHPGPCSRPVDFDPAYYHSAPSRHCHSPWLSEPS